MSANKNPKIQIQIRSNGFHVGKTTVAMIIAEALRRYGLGLRCEVKCADGDFATKFVDQQNAAHGAQAMRQKNVSIVLEDNNLLIDRASLLPGEVIPPPSSVFFTHRDQRPSRWQRFIAKFKFWE